MATKKATKQKGKVPVIEGFFTWPSDSPRLIAGRCKKCGTISFPAYPFCHNPNCEKARENVEKIELSKKGTVYSYAHQRYQPPAPFRYEPYKPYILAMVDFPEGIRIWGMMTGTNKPKIGMKVQTTVGKLYEDDKKEYITWMFKPVA